MREPTVEFPPTARSEQGSSKGPPAFIVGSASCCVVVGALLLVGMPVVRALTVAQRAVAPNVTVVEAGRRSSMPTWRPARRLESYAQSSPAADQPHLGGRAADYDAALAQGLAASRAGGSTPNEIIGDVEARQ